MKLSAFFVFILLCGLNQAQADSELGKTQQQYWQVWQSLCGASFAGEMTFPESGQDSFAGKRLVTTVSECSDNEIRVPFEVGEDTSRTWIISRFDTGIQLKHDHRHADGSPDRITDYGGSTRDSGTALSQSFPADAFTAKLIPAATTNVWTLSFDADLSTLTYHLTRHNQPRFTAVLIRVESAD